VAAGASSVVDAELSGCAAGSETGIGEVGRLGAGGNVGISDLGAGEAGSEVAGELAEASAAAVASEGSGAATAGASITSEVSGIAKLLRELLASLPVEEVSSSDLSSPSSPSGGGGGAGLSGLNLPLMLAERPRTARDRSLVLLLLLLSSAEGSGTEAANDTPFSPEDVAEAEVSAEVGGFADASPLRGETGGVPEELPERPSLETFRKDGRTEESAAVTLFLRPPRRGDAAPMGAEISIVSSVCFFCEPLLPNRLVTDGLDSVFPGLPEMVALLVFLTFAAVFGDKSSCSFFSFSFSSYLLRTSMVSKTSGVRSLIDETSSSGVLPSLFLTFVFAEGSVSKMLMHAGFASLAA
jgi:hypothetical protein